MNEREKRGATNSITSHLAWWHGAITEAIGEALKRNDGKSTPIAIPLALAPRAANDFARANQFSLSTDYEAEA